MTKLVCLTGIHAAGKTTLAAMLKEKDGFRFVPSRAKEIHESYGYKTTDPLPLYRRLDIQNIILKQWCFDVIDAADVCDQVVTDRSPIDMAAYMHLDCPRTLNDKTTKAIADYFKEAYITIDIIKTRTNLSLIRVPPWSIEAVTRGDDRLSGNVWYNHLYQSAWHFHFYQVKPALKEGVAFAELSQHTVEERYTELKTIIGE